MDIELRQLRYFLAVADELNFTRAAERLHMDQPSLSRQIRRLERALGFELFIRTSRSVVLTASGELLRRRSRELLSSFDSMLADVRRTGRFHPRTLRLGWLVPFRDQLMARLVRTFETDSNAKVELVRFDFRDPSGGLSRAVVDAAIVNPPLGTTGLSYQTLLSEPRVVIVADSNPLARRTDVTLAELDLLDQVWAVPPSTDPVWQSYRAAADAPGRTLPDRREEFAETQDYWQAVAAGHVIGLSLRAAVGEALADYGVHAIPVVDLSPAVISLAWRTTDKNPLLPMLAKAARKIRANEATH